MNSLMFMNELTWPCETAESACCSARATAFNSFLVDPSLPVNGALWEDGRGDAEQHRAGWLQLPSPNHGKNDKDKVSPPVLGEVQCQRGC